MWNKLSELEIIRTVECPGYREIEPRMSVMGDASGMMVAIVLSVNARPANVDLIPVLCHCLTSDRGNECDEQRM